MNHIYPWKFHKSIHYAKKIFIRQYRVAILKTKDLSRGICGTKYCGKGGGDIFEKKTVMIISGKIVNLFR